MEAPSVHIVAEYLQSKVSSMSFIVIAIGLFVALALCFVDRRTKRNIGLLLVLILAVVVAIVIRALL